MAGLLEYFLYGTSLLAFAVPTGLWGGLSSVADLSLAVFASEQLLQLDVGPNEASDTMPGH